MSGVDDDSASAPGVGDRFRSHVRSRWRALSVTVLAGVVVFAFSTVVFPFHSTNHDEAVYLQQAAMLLEGRLFLRPPVPDAFRPWFFVRDGGAMYAKYTPVTAGVFALGKLFAGSYRVALAGVAAGNVALAVALGRAAFDRRTGLLAGVLLLASPLFLVSSSVFLSYAPATLFNLAFAYAYVRAARTRVDSDRGRDGGNPVRGVGASRGASRGALAWAALAGVAVGLAFFARPYTAVLFALPFLVHAAHRVSVARSRRALARNAVTGAIGVAFVALTLAYNALVTGDVLTFPYEAFAPKDGLGFGTRRILGYSRDYTPALAVRANAEVLARLFARWVPLGVAGTLLAAWGARVALANDDESTRSTLRDDVESTRVALRDDVESTRDALRDDVVSPATLRRLLAGVVASVALGNVAFWGNLNVLGDLDVLGDGLVWTLGPYYHFDVLVPIAIFAAWGAQDVARRIRTRRAAASDRGERRRRGALAAGAVALVLVVAAVGVGALAHPVAANYVTSQHLADAYDPGGDDDSLRAADDAVVFLPQIYGDWLNHPLQAYRNDPGFDDDVVYALDRDGGNFAVVDAYPNRSYYRYVYRGRWAPYDRESIAPRIQAVEVASGDRAVVDVSLGAPNWTATAAVELTTDAGTVAYYVNASDVTDATAGGIDARLVVEDGRARLVGSDVTPRTGNGSVAVNGTDTVTTTVFLGSQGSSGLTYRVETPVRAGAGAAPSAAMTPYVETCVQYGTCRGGAAYLPGQADPGVSVHVDVWAVETTTANATAGAIETNAESTPSATRDGRRRETVGDDSIRDGCAVVSRSVLRAGAGGFVLRGRP